MSYDNDKDKKVVYDNGVTMNNESLGSFFGKKLGIR